MARSAPRVLAASASPSSTRCGARDSNNASLRLAGSPSAPLATTTGRRREAAADRPPLGRHGEPCPSVAHQPACFELVDQPVRRGDGARPIDRDGSAAPGPGHFRRRARAEGGWPSAAPAVVAVAQGEAHCAALAESWPVNVPAPGSSVRFMVRLREPVGPADERTDGGPVEGRHLAAQLAEGHFAAAQGDPAVDGGPDDAHLEGHGTCPPASWRE